jgi:hypothetical protein
LHDHEPAEHEAMLTFPHAGHPTKEDRDAQGQIGNCDHSRQHRDRSVGRQTIRCVWEGILAHCHTAACGLILEML